MLLFFAIIALDIGDVIFFLLDDISISTYCKEVIAMTLSLSFTAPKTSLVILILFVSLALVAGRLLRMFFTRYVSKRNINKLILFRVFLLLFCRLIPLKILCIDLAGI